MEKEIFLIGTRKMHSNKKNQDYYIVDYVDNKNIPNTDFITVEEYNRISQKMKPYTKCKGVFDFNEYKKAYLSDIKA